MNTEKSHKENGVVEVVSVEAVMNKRTGELVEMTPQKTPSQIVAMAAEAARVLEDVISQNKRKPVEFTDKHGNKKRHLEIAHWQTIAKFFHCTAATDETVPVEVHGVKGFKAKAYVIDERTKERVGSAEAYCMMDEDNWKSKPLFQIASMAQTRAASKALANKYKYVAILAGYDPTPAEEMDDEPKVKVNRTPVSMPESVKPVADRPLTIEERSLIVNKVKSLDLLPAFKEFTEKTFKVDHSSKLCLSHMPQIETWINENSSDY